MRWVEVEFQGKKHRVPAVKNKGRLWFHWQGETYVVDASAGPKRSGADKTGLNPGIINAPMPGKVTKIWVKAGDRVQKGQPLVVMEAMKMEYTLEADRDGKVDKVSAVVDAQVNLGQTLVQVGDA
jgi:biotin carboxyl carrier protein